MKILIYHNLNMKSVYVEVTKRFSDNLVMPINVCCLCCYDGAGGDLFCK